MELNGLNVLVDGYNLELLTGTGIKTYGVSLINALKLLEANVSVLFSRNSSSDPILSEILFFDVQVDSQGSTRSMKKSEITALIKGMLKATSKIFCRANKIRIKDFVIRNNIDNNLIDSVEIFNLPGCYKTAIALNSIFRIKTTITIPEKIDIWHATSPLPIVIKNAKKITTIHDLIPMKLPHLSLEDKRAYYNIVKDSIRESAIVITISENTKRDLLTFFDIDPDKICVTYQTSTLNSNSIEKEKIPNLLKKYKLKFKDYILFVGSIEPKKNIGRLIDAYNAIETDMPLVVVGKKAWLWEKEIARVEVNRVKLLEYVSTSELEYLYAGACCFVFPSLYEGFGLPPLEAMTFGCPVITSNISSLPEICGNAALYVNPYDTDDIRNGIEKMLSDIQLREKLSEAGIERAKVFSLENYTKKLYEAYSKVF